MNLNAINTALALKEKKLKELFCNCHSLSNEEIEAELYFIIKGEGRK